ncbi:MAG: hypothetical protein CM1200mP20_05810 [Pseudomonadota bacterium]|nr:MAG: hypothetical protein CM1200mP20_05810 [Pseudomonadota bacterium]
MPANCILFQPFGSKVLIRYIIRRLLIAIPTLLVISFVIFAILDLAPSDPTGNLPMIGAT